MLSIAVHIVTAAAAAVVAAVCLFLLYYFRYDLIARFNGGANAGHTLVVNKQKFAFHLLPCGMLYEGKKNIIGNGVVLDVPIMLEELR